MQRPLPIPERDLLTGYATAVFGISMPWYPMAQTSVEERTALLNMAASAELPGGLCLEIGTAFGGTAYWIGRGNELRGRGEHFLTVELYPDDRSTLQASTIIRAVRAVPYAHALTGTVDVLTDILQPRSARMAFVDADHRTEPAWHDVRRCLPLLQIGGVLAMHDVRTGSTAGQEKEWYEGPTAIWQAIQRGEVPELRPVDIIGLTGFCEVVA